MFKKLITLILLLISCINSQGQVYNFGNLRMHSGSNMAILGNFTNNGTFTSNLGTLYLNGSSLQTLNGSTGTIQSYNLILNNSAGIKLDNEFQITNTATFTSGILSTDLADINTEFFHFLDGSSYSGSSNTAHVDGVVRKTGDDSFTFPVGDAGDLQVISMSAPSLVTDHFTAYYQQTSPHPTYDVRLKEAGCIEVVSQCEYWVLNRTGGSSNVAVTLSWDSHSCGVNTLCELLVSRWDGSQWTSSGNGGTSGNSTTGTVSSGNACGSCGSVQAVSNFSPFTLAAINRINNPLPVTISSFKSICNEGSLELNWQTSSELNNAYFSIERSMDEVTWSQIAILKGAGNSNSLLNYTYVDKYNNQNNNYLYRIVQVDYDGERNIYPKLCSVQECFNKNQITIYPNPTNQTIFIKGIDIEKIVLYNFLGQELNSITTDIASQIFSFSLEALSTGFYYVNVYSKNGNCFSKKIQKEK